MGTLLKEHVIETLLEIDRDNVGVIGSDTLVEAVPLCEKLFVPVGGFVKVKVTENVAGGVMVAD